MVNNGGGKEVGSLAELSGTLVRAFHAYNIYNSMVRALTYSSEQTSYLSINVVRARYVS